MPGPSGDLEEWQTLEVNVTLGFASGDIDLLGLPFLKVTLEPRHYLYNVNHNIEMQCLRLTSKLKNTTSIEMLTQIFNTFFNESIMPKMWKRSIICPIYKGGQKEKREPLSYRPITLISNPCSIFSSIMNSRLLEFLDNNSILVEEQNVFRKNRNCLEHIFTVSSIVGSRLQEKKHTFCCFVDFSKEFDFVNRNLLIFALKQIGINGKFLNMFKAMYDIVILSDCEENMQIQLNKLSAWCTKWRMNINIDKTKIIQFRTKRSRQSNFTF